jgi:L-lactate dehydrogenase (cytochrome)
VKHIGSLDVESATDDEKAELRLKVSAEEEDEEARIKKEREAMEERGLGVIVNMRDFEVCPH